MERPSIFRTTKLIPKRRSLHVTLFAWWDALRTLHGTLFAWRGRFFFRGKTPKIAEKLRISAIFRVFCGKTRLFANFLGKIRVFSQKKGGASAKKIIISAKTKTQRASLTLFGWETRKERPECSLCETLFETLFTEDKVF